MRVGELTAHLRLDTRQFEASLRTTQTRLKATTASLEAFGAHADRAISRIDVSRLSRNFAGLQDTIRAATAPATLALRNFGNRMLWVQASSRSGALSLSRLGQVFYALRGQVTAAMAGVNIATTRAMASIRGFVGSVRAMAASVPMALAAVGGRFSAWSRNVSARMGKAGQAMQAAGSQLTRALTLPIAAIGVGAVVAAAKWETAMVGVAKTVDASTAELAKLGREFVSLSEKIPVSSNELANLGATAGQLGIAVENIRGFVEVMAALGVSTNLSAQDAATALARLANITQMPQTQFDRLGSTVVALGNNLATTEAEIVEMGLRLAGAGAKIGLTEAQILALAGALSSVGVRAEAGGTALSRVMVEIASALEMGGDKARRFAEVAGVSTDRFARMFKEDAADAVVTFIEGLGKLEGQGKSTFGVLEDLALADVRVRDALLRASGAGDLFRRSLELGNKAWAENRALTEEARKFYERLAGQFGMLRNKLMNIAAELGDTLKPAILDLVSAFDTLLDRARKVVQWFDKQSDTFKKTAVNVALITAAIGPLTVAVGGLTAAFAYLGKAALALGATAAAWTALVGVIAFFVFQVIRYWDGLVVSTKQAFASIGAAISGTVANISRWLADFITDIATVSRVLSGIAGLEAFGLVAKGADAAVESLNAAADTAQQAADRTSALVDVYERAFYAVNLLKDTAEQFGIPQEKIDSAIREIKTLEQAVEEGRLSPEKFNQFLTQTEATFIAWGKRLKATAAVTGEQIMQNLVCATGGAAGIAVPEKVLAAYSDMEQQLAQLRVRAEAFGESINVPEERLAILRAGIDQFIALGRGMDDQVNTSGQRLRDLTAEYLALAAQVDSATASLQRQVELQQFVNRMMEDMQTPVAKYLETIAKIREAAEMGLITVAQMAVLAQKAFEDAVLALKALELTVEEIAAKLGTSTDRVQTALTGVDDAITSSLMDTQKEAKMLAYGIGQQIVFGITQGVSDWGDFLKQMIMSIIRAMVQKALMMALAIASPSKLGIYAGKQITIGIGVGIEESARSTITAATNVLRASIVRGLDQTVRNISPIMSQVATIPEQVAQAIKSIGPALIDIGRIVPSGLALDTGIVQPAFAVAGAAIAPATVPAAQPFTVRVDLSDMPAPLTPEAQAVDARWQRVLTETLRAVNKRGYRNG